jgi:hypothetical protein
VFSFAILLPTWLVAKSMLKGVLETENSLKDLKKFKRNYSLMNFLSKKVLFSNGFENLRGLNFGNRNAAVKLTIISGSF